MKKLITFSIIIFITTKSVIAIGDMIVRTASVMS